MWFGAELRHQAGTKGFDFFVGKSRRLAIERNEPGDAGNLKNHQTIAQRQTHEDVARKKRQLQLHAPVLPATHGVIEWKKMLDGSLQKLLRHSLFVVCTGVGNIPARLHKLHWRLCSLWLVLSRNANHHGSPQIRRIQLRPVSHTAEINITPITTTVYSYFDRDPADFSASSGRTSFPKS